MRTRSTLGRSLVPFAAAAALLPLAAPAGAVPGVLDTTFSSDGQQTTSFSTGAELAMDMAVKGSKPVVVGVADGNMTVFRLRASGALDTDFAGTGKLAIDLGGNDWGDTVAMQGTKVLLGGSSGSLGAIVRLNGNGQPDTTFSGDGRLTFPVTALTNVFVGGIADGLEGRVVVVGRGTDSGGDLRGFVARFTNTGSLDTTFSGDGIVVFGADSVGMDVVVLGTGKVLALVAGFGTGQAGAVWRLNANGNPDTTYGGGDGAASLPTTWDERALARDGGKAVVIGTSDVAGDVGFVARFTTAGVPDPAFGGGDGSVVIVSDTIGPATATDVAVQADDAIVVGAENGNHVVLRVTAAGVLDTTFNAPLGFAEAGGAGNDRTEAVKIDTSGRILLAGSLALTGDNNRDQIVYRFLSV
jgi:uncharacterized delta-60 repeat protein